MTTQPLILALDQGTTSSRAILFSHDARPLHTSQIELKQHYPQSGWVEQDANDIWRDTLQTIKNVLSQKNPEQQIAAIGITNQRETVVLWDKTTGKPVYNAIVWQDRRTANYCQTLKDKGLESQISAKTGLLIDPYFSCSKIKWILDHDDHTAQLAQKGDLAFGTIDSFLVWNLTGGAQHVTDITNASRTGLYNIVTQEWDAELLNIYNIPAAILPDVKDNVADFGVTDPALFGLSIPIGGIAGDQQAALIGQGCFEKGMIKSTYGTGCFALMNIGAEFKQSQNRLLTTPAYRLDGQINYAIEGSIFMAGAIVQWLRDELGLVKNAAETQDLAQSVTDNNGVYLIPAFTGLGAPHWKPDARGAIMGLSRGANKAHIIRAALEAQAYQTMDLFAAMGSDAGIEANRLRVDGGLVANEFVCQFLADILQIQIDVPKVTETTALGAAYLAGLSVGMYDGLDDIANHWQPDRTYAPKMSAHQSAELYGQWSNYLSLFTQG